MEDYCAVMKGPSRKSSQVLPVDLWVDGRDDQDSKRMMAGPGCQRPPILDPAKRYDYKLCLLLKPCPACWHWDEGARITTSNAMFSM